MSKQFGARPLFHDLSFALFEGDRVGLGGPPGTGVRDFLAAVMVAIVPRTPLEKRSAATTQSSTSISC